MEAAWPMLVLISYMHEFVCYAIVCSTWKDATRNGSEGTWSDTGRFASLLPDIAWLHVHSISVLHWGMCASLQMARHQRVSDLAETARRFSHQGRKIISRYGNIWISPLPWLLFNIFTSTTHSIVQKFFVNLRADAPPAGPEIQKLVLL